MSDVEEPPTKLTKMELTKSTGDESMVSLEEGQEEWLSEEGITDEDYNTSQDNNSAHETSQDSTNLGSNQDVSQDISQFVNTSGMEITMPEHDISEQLSPTFTQDISCIAQDSADDQAQESEGETIIVMRDETENVTQESKDPNETIEKDCATNVSDTTTIGDLAIDKADEEMNDANETDEESILKSVEAGLINMEKSDETEPKPVLDKADRDLLDDLDTFLIRKSSTAPSGDKGSNERSAKNSDADDGHNTDELLEMLGEDDDVRKRKKKTILKQAPKKATLATAESTDDDAVYHGDTKITHVKLAKGPIIKKCSVKKAKDDEDFDSEMSSDEEVRLKNIFRATRTQVVRKQASATNNAGNKSKSLLKTEFNSNKNTEVKLPTSTPLKTYSRGRRAPPAPPAVPSTPPAPSRSLLRVTQKEQNGGRSNENTRKKLATEVEQQRIMRPEEMDEEMPSDMETDDSDESFYDEFPSSDSEDDEDWFTIDIRAERAADYIPLLGYKAYEILSEEKKRVSQKLSQLRSELGAAAAGARRRGAEVDAARRRAADLDNQLALA